MKEYWQEIRALTMRWVRRLSREKFSMLFTLVQPMLFWLIFFGNLFQRAADMQVTQASSYISFLTAGVVVMTVLNNGLAGGVDLLFDKENGFLERLMSTPIHRSSVILSRFIFVMTITSMQVLAILGVAWLFGVQPVTGLLGVAAILFIGMMFGVGLTAISMAMAFSVKSHGDFFSVLGFLSLPMIFLIHDRDPFSPHWLVGLTLKVEKRKNFRRRQRSAREKQPQGHGEESEWFHGSLLADCECHKKYSFHGV